MMHAESFSISLGHHAWEWPTGIVISKRFFWESAQINMVEQNYDPKWFAYSTWLPRWQSPLSLTDPVVYLPMDEIIGDVLVGSLNGTVANDMTQVAGWAGKSIYMNSGSSYVDLGSHPSECFYDPDACTKGVTFALWMRRDLTEEDGNVFCNGGNSENATGNLYSTAVCVEGSLSLHQFSIEYEYSMVPL